MGRPLRRQQPGQVYLITIRCHQARFLLRPDPALNHAVLQWLARAQQHFPELLLFAVCVMSNHLHLVVRDRSGELSCWASYFFGNLARAVNRIRKRDGACFARRYSAEPILDAEALVDRLVYTVTNPVKAGLCARAEQWPGVLLFAHGSEREPIPVSWIDRARERCALVRAKRRRERRPPASEPFRMQASLMIEPLPSQASVARDESPVFAIEAREAELGAQRREAGLRPLGVAKVLAQSWRAAPRRPKRSPRPLCHAANAALREAFREGYRAFVDLFYAASALLREGGALRIAFPDWSFPPGRPLVRPARVASG